MKKERVRAIIIKQGSILLIKRVFPDRTYWVFPGGGVEEGETVVEALERECVEELGITIKVQELFTEEVSGKEATKGDMEYFYTADITGGVLGNAFGPEHKQDSHYKGKYELVWEDGNKIMDIDLRPNEVRDRVYEHFFSK
jgi:8-oxo-dGTP pyrophosphatase MutT (NUDIX family)